MLNLVLAFFYTSLDYSDLFTGQEIGIIYILHQHLQYNSIKLSILISLNYTNNKL